MPDAARRVRFLDSGILGHRTVGGLFRDVAALLPGVDALHVDLNGELSRADRAVRRVFSLRLAPSRGPAANVDLRRWRGELNVGLLAGRRIAGPGIRTRAIRRPALPHAGVGVRQPAPDAPMRHERMRAGPGGLVQVLFIGGDFRRKGGPELLEAWRAGGFAASAALHVVTDWPAAEDGLPDGVRIVRGVAPYSDAWTELWRAADVFVMPSRHEAFGMVYQEAAAAGLPLVATRINAIPEIVEDGRTGILVPPGDPSALVQAMRALVDSAELRRRIGAAAIARIAGATPAAYAARLHRLIAMALDTHNADAA